MALVGRWAAALAFPLWDTRLAHQGHYRFSPRRRCGLRIHDGLSILVSSDVPEGKGVSSSAAVEVRAGLWREAAAREHPPLLPLT